MKKEDELREITSASDDAERDINLFIKSRSCKYCDFVSMNRNDKNAAQNLEAHYFYLHDKRVDLKVDG